MRRAANSIHANIAEAFGREYFKDKQRFYPFSRGSAYELQSHIIFGVRVHYFSEIEFETINEKIGILIIQLSKIIKTLRNKTFQ
jgi:four helix bundle protein